MDSILEQKSFQFAIRTVNLCKHLRNTKKEYTLSKQLLRAGTSIGANVTEAQRAQSRADFLSKMSIALKEADETQYWLNLLYHTGYLNFAEFHSIHQDLADILSLLTAICKNMKYSLKK